MRAWIFIYSLMYHQKGRSWKKRGKKNQMNDKHCWENKTGKGGGALGWGRVAVWHGVVCIYADLKAVRQQVTQPISATWFVGPRETWKCGASVHKLLKISRQQQQSIKCRALLSIGPMWLHRSHICTYLWPCMQLSGKVFPTDGCNSKGKDPKKGQCTGKEQRGPACKTGTFLGSFTGYSDPAGSR